MTGNRFVVGKVVPCGEVIECLKRKKKKKKRKKICARMSFCEEDAWVRVVLSITSPTALRSGRMGTTVVVTTLVPPPITYISASMHKQHAGDSQGGQLKGEKQQAHKAAKQAFKEAYAQA